MEAQYQHIGSVSTEHTRTLQKGAKNIVVYIMFAVLLLLLFILLLITGVKFSQLSKDVNDIKIQLAQTNSKPFAPSSADFQAQTETLVQPVYLTKIVPVRGKCREGWVSYERSCYLLSTTPQTWSRAETQCQNHQGHLLVVNNAEELDFISKIAAVAQSYWIGLVERQAGHWTWVDGTNYNSTQTFWDIGQPDNWDVVENGEDCGQLHASVRRMRKLWNDADCTVLYHYICESSM